MPAGARPATPARGEGYSRPLRSPCARRIRYRCKLSNHKGFVAITQGIASPWTPDSVAREGVRGGKPGFLDSQGPHESSAGFHPAPISDSL